MTQTTGHFSSGFTFPGADCQWPQVSLGAGAKEGRDRTDTTPTLFILLENGTSDDFGRIDDTAICKIIGTRADSPSMFRCPVNVDRGLWK